MPLTACKASLLMVLLFPQYASKVGLWGFNKILLIHREIETERSKIMVLL